MGQMRLGSVGSNTVPNQSHPTIVAAAAAVKVLNANPARVKYVVVNDGSTNVARINHGAAASATVTTYLANPNGGTITDHNWKGEVWAFSTGGTTLCVTEES